MTFVGISFLEASTATESVGNVLLWPGIALAGVLGFGREDWQALALYTFGNTVFYSALFLALFWVLKIGSTESQASAKAHGER